MNIGKLYQVKKFVWLLYPSKDISTAARVRSYILENSIFYLLEQDENYLKVLSTNGELGWLFYPENNESTKGCIEEVKE